MPLIAHTAIEAQEQALQWKKSGTVAFVPTMGCLHDGHLALVERARKAHSRVIVSIFVNPLQFGPNEDFDKYPRTFERDIQLLEAAGVDLVFAPSKKELYPEPFRTRVRVSALTDHLCGGKRPGHFEGVATVCMKLFSITQCDSAVFGEKDFQQLRVIEQLCTDLNLRVQVDRHPIVRVTDGLALSSRNRYLNEADRTRARGVPQACDAARRNNHSTVAHAVTAAQAVLDEARLEIDVLAICSELDLVPAPPNTPVPNIERPRFFVAVHAGQTRLIDNAPLYDSNEPPEAMK